jgi:predicted patatin/cPLA2 family phospholipase
MAAWEVKMGKKSKIRNEYNELRQLFKDMQKRKKKYDDSQDRFEDDPRAAKEIEYGRVIRKPTLISKDSVFD